MKLIISNLSSLHLAMIKTAIIALVLLLTLNARSLSQVNNDNLLQVNRLNQKAEKLSNFNLSASYDSAQLAYKLSVALNYEQGQGDALLVMGLANLMWAKYISSKNDFLKAKELFNNIQDKKGEARSLALLGKYHLKVSVTDSAIIMYKLALEIHQTLGDSTLIASDYNNLGSIYKSKDDYSTSLKYYLKAGDINEAYENYEALALNNNNIAILHVRQRDYHQAKIFVDKALRAINKTSNKKVLGDIYNSKGLIFNNLKAFDSALHYHFKASKIALSIGDTLGAAIPLNNVANSFLQAGELDKALEVAFKAYGLKMKTNNIKSQVFGVLLIGDVYRARNEADKAIEWNLKGLRLAQDHGFMDRERVALLYLAQSYEIKGDYKNAHDYHIKYAALQDSIFDIQRSNQLAELQTTFETEKKNQQIIRQEQQLKSEANQRSFLIIISSLIFVIALLAFLAFRKSQKKNKLLALQKKEIEERSHEKEVLLKEIHHRVKNNLQIISSLLNIQSRRLESESAKDAVREGQSRIKSMALIHQRLYSTDNLSQINMKEYIDQLSQFLFKTYNPSNNIERVVDLENIELDIDTAIPLGLIINELISNALKYAFEVDQSGRLEVTLSKKQGQLVLSVSDSGKGLPSSFNLNETSSMGLSLVNELTKQINGKLELNNRSGTSITIYFGEKAA